MFRSVRSNVLNSPEKVKIETLRILATSDRLGYVQNVQAYALPRIANPAAENTAGPGGEEDV
jgi:DNA-binding LacI/PurR family transcriptional regulator